MMFGYQCHGRKYHFFDIERVDKINSIIYTQDSHSSAYKIECDLIFINHIEEKMAIHVQPCISPKFRANENNFTRLHVHIHIQILYANDFVNRDTAKINNSYFISFHFASPKFRRTRLSKAQLTKPYCQREIKKKLNFETLFQFLTINKTIRSPCRLLAYSMPHRMQLPKMSFISMTLIRIVIIDKRS